MVPSVRGERLNCDHIRDFPGALHVDDCAPIPAVYRAAAEQVKSTKSGLSYASPESGIIPNKSVVLDLA